MNIQEVIDIPRGPNQSVMAVMGKEGDIKTIWDRTKPEEVAEARSQFKRLMDTNRFIAHKVEGKDARRGEVLRDFDPNAESIIFALRMVGG